MVVASHDSESLENEIRAAPVTVEMDTDVFLTSEMIQKFIPFEVAITDKDTPFLSRRCASCGSRSTARIPISVGTKFFCAGLIGRMQEARTCRLQMANEKYSVCDLRGCVEEMGYTSSIRRLLNTLVGGKVKLGSSSANLLFCWSLRPIISSFSLTPFFFFQTKSRLPTCSLHWPVIQYHEPGQGEIGSSFRHVVGLSFIY